MKDVYKRQGQNLKHAVGEVEDGDVEGAAAQVKDQDARVGALLVQAIGKSSSGRLVDEMCIRDRAVGGRRVAGTEARAAERRAHDRAGLHKVVHVEMCIRDSILEEDPVT